MAEEKKKVTQSMLVSDNDIALLKSIFSDNDDLLKLVRNLFFGLELTAEEKELIVSTFKNDDARRLIRQRFIPYIRKDVPIGQTVDLWTGVDVKGKYKDEIYQSILGRKMLIEMTNKALGLLENPDDEKVSLDFNPTVVDINDLQVELIARNTFISHVEMQLMMIKIIAGQKTETVEGAKKRLTQDSNQ